MARIFQKGDDENEPKETHITPNKDSYTYYYSEPLARSFKIKYTKSVDLSFNNFIGDEYEIDIDEFKPTNEN